MSCQRQCLRHVDVPMQGVYLLSLSVYIQCVCVRTLPLAACKIQTEDFLKMLFYTSRTGILCTRDLVFLKNSPSWATMLRSSVNKWTYIHTTKRTAVCMMLHYWGVCI